MHILTLHICMDMCVYACLCVDILYACVCMYILEAFGVSVTLTFGEEIT